ncbi:helix-turn-helix domain-containing protein [Sulfuriferula sp.]|uniref:helix-turn-helix domain-containing protein n=1 Tax=Sulfuriferula sp. TaxID=2025307 RepID=UPI0027310228|nr:helix-turn-helix transcriptional regulator [Sulfuriferula sp.]MDP2026427.1 helix-turn-helix transcriptional regulator [Sulfuriferula sp.]
MDITKIISDNLTSWMQDSTTLSTMKAVARASGVGFGTIQRAKNGDGNITVQNLAAIAHAFRRSAIDLLANAQQPYIVATPIAPFAIQQPPPDERELIEGYRAASPDVREIMLDAARRALQKSSETGGSKTQ